MTEMTENENEDVYSVKRLKQKLQDRYKDHLFFAEVIGRKNVVCFRDMAGIIINDKWYEAKRDKIEDQSERVVLAAAKIIKAQIREMSYSNDFYPSNDDFCDVDAACQWLSSMLPMFLQPIVKSTVKRAAIGQCLVRPARTRSVIPPLLFGLGVELDHVFGSKWLINELFCLGYSISYNEVTRFKQNSIVSSNFEDVLPKYPDSVTQWVVDNVDHNICALDGKNTFHGMGVIAVSTPFEQP